MINGRKIGYLPSGSFDAMPVKEVCSILKGIGYDAVEWQISVLNPRTHSIAQIQETVQETQSCGLEISEVVLSQELVTTDEAARHDRIAFCAECIEALPQAGVHTVNLFTGPMPWMPHAPVVGRDISQGAAWDMLFDAFDTLLPLAKKHGVTIAMENVWGMLCDDFFTMKHLIDHYNDDHLGVNYDPSHDILAGHTDIPWIVKNWGSRIKHVHLKDAAGIGRLGQFVFPLLGEGNVDWNRFFAALDSVGYQGFLSVEFESFAYVKRIFKDDWVMAARQAYENLSILLQDT